MARPRLHSPDAVLDATLALVLDDGAPAATVAAIAKASGAPTGSIYHSFASREDLLARMWIRAAQRSQACFLDAAAGMEGDPRAAARAAAMSVFDFARERLADARLLASMRLEDLLGAAIDPALARELRRLNDPVERAIGDLAARLAEGAGARESVALATIDIPQGAVRRHLVAGSRPPATLRIPLERAVDAAIDVIHKRGDRSE